MKIFMEAKDRGDLETFYKKKNYITIDKLRR